MVVLTETRPSLDLPLSESVIQMPRPKGDQGKHTEDSSPSASEGVDRILSTQYVDGIWKIAGKTLKKTDNPDLYPHYTLPGLPYYVYHGSSFWTSGFFPGSVWAVYERSLKVPLSVPSEDLLLAARKWQANMAAEQHCTNNHDLGFMIMPSYARDYNLTGCRESLEVVVNSARAMATRFDTRTRVIRSWAGARTKVYDLNDPNDFVVVIDSMMNLDLLYYAAEHTGEKHLAEIATTHAKTTLKNHVRKNFSTYHLVNYDARNGDVRGQMTNQGYENESTWARGQAWALYGFASVYYHTKDPLFLDAACRLADYFLSRVDKNGEDAGVVYWDFDAPRPGVWDVSAACCASSGLLFLHQLLKSTPVANGNADKAYVFHNSIAERWSTYLDRAHQILDTVARRATSTGDALFERSTCNDHVNALHRLAEHGCVYADYYFLEAGNRLIDIRNGVTKVTTYGA